MGAYRLFVIVRFFSVFVDCCLSLAAVCCSLFAVVCCLLCVVVRCLLFVFLFVFFVCCLWPGVVARSASFRCFL